jgi:transposase-like protein
MLVVQDGVVSSSPGPREGGPRRRRAFTAREKLDHLTAYEAACAAGDGGGGAYLREQGVYSSQITEWRKLRDAGLLSGRKPGEKIGRPTTEQAEIARLTRELDLTRRRLATTEAALDLVGKAHALLEDLSERADTEKRPRQR